MARQRELIQAVIQQADLGSVLLHFGDISAAVRSNVQTSMTVTDAKRLVDVIRGSKAQPEGVGLTPPSFTPGRPDFDVGHAILVGIKQRVATSS